PPPSVSETETPSGSEVTKLVNEKASTIDSLSTFTSYLKDLELSDEEVSEGITIFAPIDQAFVNQPERRYQPSSNQIGRKYRGAEGKLRKRLPDSSDIEDYIVKGIIRFEELTDGKKFNTIN